MTTYIARPPGVEIGSIRVTQRWHYLIVPSRDIEKSESVFLESLSYSDARNIVPWFDKHKNKENKGVWTIFMDAKEGQAEFIDTGVTRDIDWTRDRAKSCGEITLGPGELCVVYPNKVDIVGEIVMTTTFGDRLDPLSSRACSLPLSANTWQSCEGGSVPGNGLRTITHIFRNGIGPGEMAVAVFEVKEGAPQFEQHP